MGKLADATLPGVLPLLDSFLFHVQQIGGNEADVNYTKATLYDDIKEYLAVNFTNIDSSNVQVTVGLDNLGIATGTALTAVMTAINDAHVHLPDGFVELYTDLPDPSVNTGKSYAVKQFQLIYISQGTAWLPHGKGDAQLFNGQVAGVVPAEVINKFIDRSWLLAQKLTITISDDVDLNVSEFWVFLPGIISDTNSGYFRHPAMVHTVPVAFFDALVDVDDAKTLYLTFTFGSGIAVSNNRPLITEQNKALLGTIAISKNQGNKVDFANVFPWNTKTTLDGRQSAPAIRNLVVNPTSGTREFNSSQFTVHEEGTNYINDDLFSNNRTHVARNQLEYLLQISSTTPYDLISTLLVGVGITEPPKDGGNGRLQFDSGGTLTAAPANDFVGYRLFLHSLTGIFLLQVSSVTASTPEDARALFLTDSNFPFPLMVDPENFYEVLRFAAQANETDWFESDNFIILAGNIGSTGGSTAITEHNLLDGILGSTEGYHSSQNDFNAGFKSPLGTNLEKLTGKVGIGIAPSDTSLEITGFLKIGDETSVTDSTIVDGMVRQNSSRTYTEANYIQLANPAENSWYNLHPNNEILAQRKIKFILDANGEYAYVNDNLFHVPGFRVFLNASTNQITCENDDTGKLTSQSLWTEEAIMSMSLHVFAPFTSGRPYTLQTVAKSSGIAPNTGFTGFIEFNLLDRGGSAVNVASTSVDNTVLFTLTSGKYSEII